MPWINQSTNFKNVLTFKENLKRKVLPWGRGYSFVSTGNKRLWIHLRLIRDQIWSERPPESLLTDRNKPKITTRQKNIFYLLKQTRHLWWVCIQHIAHTCVNVCYLSKFVFSEQGDKAPIKMDDPRDPASQIASVIVSSEFCIQNSFKAAGWDGPSS